MSSRGIDETKTGHKLEYGRPTDKLKNAAKISVGDKNVLIQPVKTSSVGIQRLDNHATQRTSQQTLSRRGDGSSALSRPPSLQGRVRRSGQFSLNTPGKLTLGNKILRGVCGFVGAMVTGAAGSIAGAVGGSLLGPGGILGFGIGLGTVGVASGAAGWVRIKTPTRAMPRRCCFGRFPGRSRCSE